MNLAHWSPPADGASQPICNVYPFQQLRGGLCKLFPSTRLTCKGTFTWPVLREWGLKDRESAASEPSIGSMVTHSDTNSMPISSSQLWLPPTAFPG